MEIKKEKELLDQQSASQQEKALLKIIQLLLCLILSAWQRAGPSFPPGEAERCQLTRVCRGICYLRCRAPVPRALWLAESPLPPGKRLCSWHGAFHSSSGQQLGGRSTPRLPHVSGKVGSDFVPHVEDSPGRLDLLWHPTMARRGAQWTPGTTLSFPTTQPLPGAHLGDLACSCQSHITDI